MFDSYPRPAARGSITRAGATRACLLAVAVANAIGCGRVGYERRIGDDPPLDAGTREVWKECLVGEGPIVLYAFPSAADPSVVPDSAPLPPDVPLALEPRDPPGAAIREGELVLSGGMLVASPAHSLELGLALVAADRLTVEAWARPDTIDFGALRGPRRIVTLSQNQCDRSFLLGQEEADMQLRLRTTFSDGEICPVIFASAPVFDASLGPRHLALTYDAIDGVQRGWVDGTLAVEASHAPGATFDLWTTGLDRLRVGDENSEDMSVGFDRRFAGTIQRIAIYRRVLSAGELSCIARAGP